jgi:hypothetical protein
VWGEVLTFGRYCAVLLVCFCVLTSASLASPQDYCDLFAKDAANRKTGQSVITRTIDNSSAASKANTARPRVLPEIENWQRAYEQSVTACLKNYRASLPVEPMKTADAARGAKVIQHRPAQSRSSKRPQQSFSKAKGKTKSLRSRRSTRSRSRTGASQQTKIESKKKGGGRYQRSQASSSRGAARATSQPQQLTGSSPPIEPKTMPGSSPQSRKCPRSGDPTCGGH